MGPRGPYAQHSAPAFLWPLVAPARNMRLRARFALGHPRFCRPARPRIAKCLLSPPFLMHVRASHLEVRRVCSNMGPCRIRASAPDTHISHRLVVSSLRDSGVNATFTQRSCSVWRSPRVSVASRVRATSAPAFSFGCVGPIGILRVSRTRATLLWLPLALPLLMPYWPPLGFWQLGGGRFSLLARRAYSV